MDLSIFDLRISVDSEDKDDLKYIAAFMDAFDDVPSMSPRTIVRVRVQRQSLPPAAGPTVPIHRSKHSHWNFDGCLLSEHPRTVLWPSRGVIVTVDDRGKSVTVGVRPDLPQVLAGEAIFHAIRGVCLALRPPGFLLHASAVVGSGHAVAFCGGSLSGKTTVMTQLVLRHGAQPLTNDRLLLMPGPSLRAHAWPSYASYCEGTLLEYPELQAAAVRYESDECAYGTRRWPEPLTRTFDKGRKRTYPMVWFKEAAGRGFARQAKLTAVAFLRVSPQVEQLRATRLSASGVTQLPDRLQEVMFPARDPSFMPWHGLAMPVAAPAQALLDSLVQAGVSLHELEVPAADVAAVHGFVEGVLNDPK